MEKYQVLKQGFSDGSKAYAILWRKQKNGNWLVILIHETNRNQVKTYSIRFLDLWRKGYLIDIPKKHHAKINQVANKLQKKEKSPLLNII